jgi:hypothetical protein
MRWRWGILAAAALGAGALFATTGLIGGGESRAWRELPAPPLSPREFPAGFWTGHEVVLVGGSDAPPCPPNASCEPPDDPPLADGAAYDPASNSWRAIADPPMGFSWAEPVVIGSTAYLWIPGESYRPKAPSAFLAYRVEEDRWEELPLPTPDGVGWYHLASAGPRVVAYASSDEERERPDLIFDPETSSWSELPDDPFSPGFDRVLLWDGDELLLFDHELTEDLAADLPLRGAALDLATGRWRVLDDAEAAYPRVRPDESPAAPPGLEDAQGGTTKVAAGRDHFLFLGSSWPEGDPDGELHSEAWLWSPGSSS